MQSAVLGWFAALFLVLCLLTSQQRYLPLFITGVLSNGLAFYWLDGTIGTFGGFSPIAAALIYCLFVVISSLQYTVVSFLFRYLPLTLDRFALRGAVAWVAGEFLSVRIFPWFLGHTQLSFAEFAQAASVAAVPLISFVMIWLSEGAIRSLGERRFHPGLKGAGAIFSLLLVYGWWELLDEGLLHETQSVALVQANLSIERKGDVAYFSSNEERYRALSSPFQGSSTLVIWPETAIQEWIPAQIGHVRNNKHLPSFEKQMPLLVGALSFSSRTATHNSAFGILPTGEVLPPYHKRILMPFGEYTPFSDLIPFLASMNANVAEFHAGKKVEVFEYPLLTEGGSRILKVSPLICYEDIVPSLSRESVIQGAELLVNLTNDAWFGDSVAPLQHHLIASFRAIENRRSLIRSTNTGLTAVVTPWGKTTASLPLFQEGTLLAEVPVIRYNTLYTRYLGEKPWWLLSSAAVVLVLLRLLQPLARRRARGVTQQEPPAKGD